MDCMAITTNCVNSVNTYTRTEIPYRCLLILLERYSAPLFITVAIYVFVLRNDRLALT